MSPSQLSTQSAVARRSASGQLLTLMNVVLALCLAPASAWAQGTEAALGGAFDDALRLLFLFIGDGIGLALVVVASSSQRREILGVTFLVGMVVTVAAAIIALHYGSWLSTASLDASRNRFAANFPGKFIWSIVTGVIGLAGIVISLVRVRVLPPSDP